jgi:hypothetical protein
MTKRVCTGFILPGDAHLEAKISVQSEMKVTGIQPKSQL